MPGFNESPSRGVRLVDDRNTSAVVNTSLANGNDDNLSRIQINLVADAASNIPEARFTVVVPSFVAASGWAVQRLGNFGFLVRTDGVTIAASNLPTAAAWNTGLLASVTEGLRRSNGSAWQTIAAS